MHHEFISVLDVQVALYKKGTGKPTLFFIHGNSLGAETFSNQWNSDLFKDFQLITLDLPGHGKSGRRTHVDFYSLKTYVSIIHQVVEKLSLQHIVFIGHSLGGHIAIEALPEIRDKVDGLIIFGTPPLGNLSDFPLAFLPNEATGIAYLGDLDHIKASQFAQACVLDTPTEFLIDLIMTTDPNARLGLGASVSKGEFRDEKIILQELEFPVLVIHGEKDEFINLEYISSQDISTLKKGGIQILKNCGHSPQIERPDQFNEIILNYSTNL